MCGSLKYGFSIGDALWMVEYRGGVDVGRGSHSVGRIYGDLGDRV